MNPFVYNFVSTLSSLASGPDHIFIRISGNNDDLLPLRDAAWQEILQVVPGTRLELIPDPLRHIVRLMVGPEYIGRLGWSHVWHWRDRFYSSNLCYEPCDLPGYVQRDRPSDDITELLGASTQELRPRGLNIFGHLLPYGQRECRDPGQVREVASRNPGWYSDYTPDGEFLAIPSQWNA